MISVFDVISNHFSTGHTHCPTQSHPHMFYFHLLLSRVLRISEGVADCRKSGYVSTTHMNKLQHMLLWTVGSTVIRSRKIKSFAYVRIFWNDFCRFWEALAQLLILRPRNLLRPMILESRKWEQLLLQISNSVGTLCWYERIKNVWVWLTVGQWAWPGEMWLDIAPHTHIILLSWDITCNLC